ncbi:MAG: sigma-54-dependent Fis family transcriptional regulator, partial [Deltaproteobacteria bacterium]|nr:sigma-54-dependent Fis family transcriptional regulator [Candidatus Tharpellaceae bacterium]
MMLNRILIIDDEKLIRESLSHLLTGAGYQVDLAADGAQAKQLFTQHTYDLALIDLRLPDCNGIELLKIFKTAVPDQGLMCIMMTAYGSVDSAVQAKKYNINNMIAVDPLMIKTFEVVKKVAANRDVSVLIQGESGTGKELIAKSLHYLSSRAAKPFVSINCASIPGNLLESELFGYERGAFTDAKSRKHGLLEKAEGGTVFLDEIGDMDPSLQAKLLRVLEESRFRRLGSVSDITIDVRFVSATNQILEKLIEKGTFREDLYYRLKVINITIPPLRERKQDIEVLLKYFIDHFPFAAVPVAGEYPGAEKY